MSKLSEPLKQFIGAAHAKPHTIPAPPNVASVYERIAAGAGSKKVGLPAWLCASAAATFTMNSPDSLLALHRLAASSPPPPPTKVEHAGVYAAELMREVGLKCIGFNGVPRTINCLDAFYRGLPGDVQAALRARKPRRALAAHNVDDSVARGARLWHSVYHPFADKLAAKLARSHPDLPVFIVHGEYGALFSDPPPPPPPPPHRPDVGRVLTSIVAVACLRAQTGVGPQVVSHVFGLRKAFDDGTAESDHDVPGGKWLASDHGSLWLLEQVDSIVHALGAGRGTTFAPGFDAAPQAKL